MVLVSSIILNMGLKCIKAFMIMGSSLMSIPALHLLYRAIICIYTEPRIKICRYICCMVEDIKSRYGNQFEPELLEEMARVGTMQVVPEGQELIRPGQYMKHMPLLISGSIKIMRPDSDGEELLLYYLEEGDTCTMTMACCVGHTKSEIRAVSETPVEIVMIPTTVMEDWTGKYKSWRQFVFKSYHNRMMEMLDSIDDLAFKNMEERLQRYIENKTEITGEDKLYTTHQEIARDLHTSRVVISRLLKKMENEGQVQLHRNFIEVV